jgi:hypothetical protein
MRAFSAVILLLIQARPLWGLVLCMGLGVADQGRMESGCAMADQAGGMAGAAETSGPAVANATSDASHADGHGCMLADICNLITPTAALRPSLLLVPNTPRSSSAWPSETIYTQEHSAPPTPPPNA